MGWSGCSWAAPSTFPACTRLCLLQRRTRRAWAAVSPMSTILTLVSVGQTWCQPPWVHPPALEPEVGVSSPLPPMAGFRGTFKCYTWDSNGHTNVSLPIHLHHPQHMRMQHVFFLPDSMALPKAFLIIMPLPVSVRRQCCGL